MSEAQLVRFETGAPAAGGGCVSRMPDGRVAFVRHALPGEVVVGQVLQQASTYVRAEAVEVLEPSPARVRPPCPYAGPGGCGGCDWQHVSVPAQREMKALLVKEQLRRVAGVEWAGRVEAVPGPIGVDEGLGWRTRVRFAVQPPGEAGREPARLGMRRWRSHEVVPVEGCLIASPDVEDLGAERLRWPGAAEVEIFAAGGQALVSVTGAPGRGTVRVPPVRAGVVVDGRVVRRPGWLDLTARGRQFRVRAGSFWQVHVSAAEVLAAAVLDGAGLSGGEAVADLYSGSGLLASVLAESVGRAGSVVAVEHSESAHHDALRNLADLPHAVPLRSRVDPGLVSERLGSPQVVVLDPPRAGAGVPVMRALAGLAPALRRVVYVSCEPASFARDLRALLALGWRLSDLRVLDLFPMTEHVELVAVIESGS